MALYLYSHRRVDYRTDGRLRTDTPTLGFSGFLLPSAQNVKYSTFSPSFTVALHTLTGVEYPKPGNESQAIRSVYTDFDLDEMKAFLTHFSSYVLKASSSGLEKRTAV